MERSPNSLLDKRSIRFALMVIVTLLLNFGLFFILNFLAPFVSGLVVGYIITKYTDAIAATYIGTALSYFIIFFITEWFLGFTNNLSDIVFAVIIMGGIGVLGGLIGAILGKKRFAGS